MALSDRVRLEGKVAVVAGAGSDLSGTGTGAAISVLMAMEGAKVVVADRAEDRADHTRETIVGLGGECVAVTADVTSSRDCEAAVRTAVENYDRIDVLVNNLGITRHGPTIDVSDEDWDELLKVNLKAMMLMSRHAIPEMISRGGGSVINISSTGAFRPSGGYAAYDAAKGGVVSLTIGLAVEHGRQGVRANCIVPGRLLTPMASAVSDRANRTDEQQRYFRSTNVLGSIGDAWDVGWTAVFLASDEARWITGVTVPVDGGLLCTPPELGGLSSARPRSYSPPSLREQNSTGSSG
jgi:NAD(P)-dependent dehydrogenase (short-subunit alcohol dehydrogenase family)